MKEQRFLFVLSLVILSLALYQPFASAMAKKPAAVKEHAGKEHAGKEHGGEALSTAEQVVESSSVKEHAGKEHGGSALTPVADPADELAGIDLEDVKEQAGDSLTVQEHGGQPLPVAKPS